MICVQKFSSPETLAGGGRPFLMLQVTISGATAVRLGGFRYPNDRLTRLTDEKKNGERSDDI